MSADIAVERHRRFEGIVLRSSSYVVASIPYVSVLDPRVCPPIVTIRDDCGSACSSEGNVGERLESGPDHRAPSSHRPR